MQDALISRFNNVQSLVKLNTPITSIDYGGDTINLTAKDGTVFTANKVIVTVPISVLKSGGLSFSPGLPGSFSGSLAKLDMGPCVRAIIEFKKNFWGDSIGYMIGSGNVPEYFSMGLGRSQFNATLSVTVNGPKALQYSSLGEAGMIDAILADLDVLYGGQATQFIRKKLENFVETNQRIFVAQDWTNMDYIRGGFSYPLPGATNNDRKAIGQPVGNKLFFAGEATDITGQAGMVNGALASAERAAQEIVEAIKAGA
jgi:monoamine oxidase